MTTKHKFPLDRSRKNSKIPMRYSFDLILILMKYFDLWSTRTAPKKERTSYNFVFVCQSLPRYFFFCPLKFHKSFDYYPIIVRLRFSWNNKFYVAKSFTYSNSYWWNSPCVLVNIHKLLNDTKKVYLCFV